MTMNNPFGGTVHTENLSQPKDTTGRRTMHAALDEDARRVSAAFGLDTDAGELEQAYASLRGKSNPRVLAELVIRIGRVETMLRELREKL
jgi:hypothetical protein